MNSLAATELAVKTWKAGAAASLAHDHVARAPKFSGTASLEELSMCLGSYPFRSQVREAMLDLRPTHLALLLNAVFVLSCGPTAVPTSDLFETCKQDEDCSDGLFCMTGFCSKECSTAVAAPVIGGVQTEYQPGQCVSSKEDCTRVLSDSSSSSYRALYVRGCCKLSKGGVNGGGSCVAVP